MSRGFNRNTIMMKIDYKKELKHLYKPSPKKVELVDVPAMNYLMIMQPELITKKMVNAAIEQVRTKKNPPALPLIRFESYTEGKCAQVMHLGPFSEEEPTVEKVHTFIEENGYKRRGKHRPSPTYH